MLRNKNIMSFTFSSMLITPHVILWESATHVCHNCTPSYTQYSSTHFHLVPSQQPQRTSHTTTTGTSTVPGLWPLVSLRSRGSRVRARGGRRGDMGQQLGVTRDLSTHATRITLLFEGWLVSNWGDTWNSRMPLGQGSPGRFPSLFTYGGVE